ncbi:methionine ABC transporter ATP-binding protein [Erysipelothrix rhusiopathiae]|nr:methionine ABC transporter ATP-binding protein [Erysipelothrix rhusiopathiae]AYV34164.1 methionine ABC transporter ATP-binding protein [Erysipelothrix rhusiopathiae]MDE8070382.1 methionine ABC transporter ATP-binding protein [Erysipelothrix rhusiopathiae]MDE8333654.1 methionine ABC transporter ATP-binding protein [Erysipelothrix rhusiopathiae]
MIEFKNVSKHYQGKNKTFKALDNVSFEIKQSEIFGIIGESGAGKSTALRLINGLELPDEGAVFIDGTDLKSLSSNALRSLRKEIGVVFQNFNLLGNRTVFDNIALPLRLAKNKDCNMVSEALCFVHLESKIHHYPAQLSGGERQRVAIARALITKPKILICDEPSSALDPHTTKEILEVLKQINQQFGTTIVIVTHELEVAKMLCDRVAILDNGTLHEVISVNRHDEDTTTPSYAIHAKDYLLQ